MGSGNILNSLGGGTPILNLGQGGIANPGGYIWGAAGKKLKPKVPGQTPEELALQRAQLSAIYKQDEEINAKKLRILRGESSSFSSLLRSGSFEATTTAAAASSGSKGIGEPPPRGKSI